MKENGDILSVKSMELLIALILFCIGFLYLRNTFFLLARKVNCVMIDSQ